jgi:hypothetical protein
MPSRKGHEKDKSGQISEESWDCETDAPEEDRRAVNEGVRGNPTLSHLAPDPGHNPCALPSSNCDSEDGHPDHPPYDHPCADPTPDLNQEGNFDKWKKEEKAADTRTDETPSWAPDGRKIVFSSQRRGRFDLYVMDWNGENVERLTQDAGQNIQPAWGPQVR